MRVKSRGDDGNDNGWPILVDAVLMNGQQRQRDLYNDVDADRDPFGFDLPPGGSDRFVSILLHEPRSVDCTNWFTNMLRGLTSERTRVMRREGG